MIKGLTKKEFERLKITNPSLLERWGLIRKADRPGACPECGASLTREEGCVVCHSCGYSECG